MSDVADLAEALGRRLDVAEPELVRLERYLLGRQPLAFATEEAAEQVRPVVVNLCRLVVRSIAERLTVDGFRTAPGSSADASLWTSWQGSNLDEAAALAHAEALAYGRAYAMVWGDPATGEPLVTVESARQVYVAHAPGSRRRTAAIKRWCEDGRGHAVVLTPAEVVRLRTIGRVVEAEASADGTTSLPVFPTGSGWQVVERRRNPMQVVPVVPVVHAARLLHPDGESVLADAIPLVDAISKVVTDMLTGSEATALPRRWATGIELPEETDEEGLPTGDVAEEPFNPLAGRTWLAESEAARFGQLPGADLGGFTGALRTLTAQLGAVTGLPPHYVGLSTENPSSADAIRSAEASLVKRAEDAQRSFGGAWEDVMRLVLLARSGVERPGAEGMETIWRSPETRTVAQAADAAAKLAGIGVPLEALLPSLGYTPVEIENIRTMRRREALDSAGVDLRQLGLGADAGAGS